MHIRLGARAGEGTHEGCTYVGARGRAPTRGAPTVGLFARTGEGTHEGGTYGWMTWARGGGHPRGVHIRLGDVGARGRAPTRGGPTVGLFARAGEGTHEGCPYGWMAWARGGGHPRGVAPTVGWRGRAGEGTHEGCPYGWIICARGGGHPRGVPLRLDY